MAHNVNYIGNYSPTSFQFFHQDHPLNVDLSHQLDFPSVSEAHEWLQVLPISTDCGVNLQTPFQILKLMGTISKLLMEEMDKDSFLWKDEEMWRLYCVIRTLNEIQIVVRLKEKIRGKVQRLKQQRKKHGNRKTTKLEQDGNAACSSYMDQVFFKILIDLIEKDYGESVAATVKIL
ncbi:unnamed protein product [Orchesella dallaii]|uniref:Uncharacterized protein n=1 Tax=Orchesella dallaii TaxID=48710 RepID=A0ABP1PMB6_9HEXA